MCTRPDPALCREVFDGCAEAVYVIDTELLTVSAANAAAFERSRLGGSGLIGKSAAALWPNWSRSEMRATLNRTARLRPAGPCGEHRTEECSTGTPMPALLRFRPLCSCRTKNHALVFSMLLPELASAVFSPFEFNPFLQTLINVIPNPTFFKDRSGHYIGCNRAFEAFTGLELKDIIGKNVHDIFPHQTADDYQKSDAALLGSAVSQVFESRLRRYDGADR
ncbi:MAG: PAS domain-containing protein, partial [Candidatus Omnitrophota bacterium]